MTEFKLESQGLVVKLDRGHGQHVDARTGRLAGEWEKLSDFGRSSTICGMSAPERAARRFLSEFLAVEEQEPGAENGVDRFSAGSFPPIGNDAVHPRPQGRVGALPP